MRKTLPLVGMFAVAAVSLIAVLALGPSPAEACNPADPSDWSCWFSSDPPTDSVGFFGSGQFMCEFARRDRPEGVNVFVAGPDINKPLDSINQTIQTSVHLSGLAACGPTPAPPATRLEEFAFFAVDITVGCVTRTPTANGFQYRESFGDCSAAQLISGSLTQTPLTPVPPTFSLQCATSPCVIEVGVDSKISAGNFKNNVCPKDPASGLTSNGQVFAFSEHFVNKNHTLLRPGIVGACYCNSHLDDPNSVVQCTSNQPQTVATSGASQCVFEYQKLGNGQAVINASGSPRTLNAALVDSLTCPVTDISQKDVRVCDDVTPIAKSFKIQTNGGQTTLSFQFDEGACRNSLDPSTLIPGDF